MWGLSFSLFSCLFARKHEKLLIDLKIFFEKCSVWLARTDEILVVVRITYIMVMARATSAMAKVHGLWVLLFVKLCQLPWTVIYAINTDHCCLRKVMVWCITTGWSDWFTVWSACLPLCGNHSELVHTDESVTGIGSARRHPACLIYHGPVADDWQLCPPDWICIRFSTRVCLSAVHHV